MSMGTEVDLHTPHWHGNTVTVNGMRMDVVSLLPGDDGRRRHGPRRPRHLALPLPRQRPHPRRDADALRSDQLAQRVRQRFTSMKPLITCPAPEVASMHGVLDERRLAAGGAEILRRHVRLRLEVLALSSSAARTSCSRRRLGCGPRRARRGSVFDVPWRIVTKSGPDGLALHEHLSGDLDAHDLVCPSASRSTSCRRSRSGRSGSPRPTAPPRCRPGSAWPCPGVKGVQSERQRKPPEVVGPGEGGESRG